MMRRTRKVSNVYGKVRFEQKQRLTIAFTGNTIHQRKQSRKGTEDFIVDKKTCNCAKSELPYGAPKKP